MKNNFILTLAALLIVFSCSTEDLQLDRQNINNTQNVNLDLKVDDQIESDNSKIQLEADYNNLETSNPIDRNSTVSIEISEDVNASLGIGSGIPLGNNCPDFEAPVASLSETSDFVIRYNSTIPVNEINCIRKEYFERFPCLRMSAIQSSDPYIDAWVVINNIACGGPTAGGTENVREAIEDDDRVEEAD